MYLAVTLFSFSDEEENKTDGEQLPNSNPANCNDILKLGYTLNGYYLVNCIESVKRFEVVFCQFKQKPGANKGKDR